MAGLHLDHDEENHFDSSDNVDDDYEDHDDENHDDSSDNVDDDYEDHDDGEDGLARQL